MKNERKRAKAIIIEFRGNFNPQIFHPSWFSKHSLILDAEAEVAELKIIHNELSSFSIPNSFNFEVTQNQLRLTTLSEGYASTLRDLAVNVFKILANTPITSFFIELSFHYEPEDVNDVNAFENIILPQIIRTDNYKPRLLTLVVEHDKPDNEGIVVKRTLSIEISDYVDNSIYFQVNELYDLGDKVTENSGSVIAIDVLRKKWDDSLADAEGIFDDIWQNFEKIKH